jgi:mono/diheme cytochrome c family protein
MGMGMGGKHGGRGGGMGPGMMREAPSLGANPVPADEASVARGRALYDKNCVVCHGSGGRGNGPAAAGLNPRPADLVALAGSRPDGYLAGQISGGRGAMPSFQAVLSESGIWDITNYLKSLAK